MTKQKETLTMSEFRPIHSPEGAGRVRLPEEAIPTPVRAKKPYSAPKLTKLGPLDEDDPRRLAFDSCAKSGEL